MLAAAGVAFLALLAFVVFEGERVISLTHGRNDQ